MKRIPLTGVVFASLGASGSAVLIEVLSRILENRALIAHATSHFMTLCAICAFLGLPLYVVFRFVRARSVQLCFSLGAFLLLSYHIVGIAKEYFPDMANSGGLVNTVIDPASLILGFGMLILSLFFALVHMLNAQVELREKQQRLSREVIEREHAEEHRTMLEEQLRHAHKMEAVGTLAGGVAHDFNNLLQVIQLGLEMAYAKLDSLSPARESLAHVAKAADRAAALVRQLLTFSRRENFEAQRLDVNDLVTGLGEMLRRVIGEHIELIIQLGKGVLSVVGDVGETEQILMNLCVNARDAMPKGGKILIETRNLRLQADDCQGQPDAKEGEYVLLSVSDTGCGVPRDIQGRIFEPFFTTKEVGQGTGLGLATVYAIAKRQGGFVRLYSEEGQGAVFHVYLPTAAKENEAFAPVPSPAKELQGGNETILFAEDDEQVRLLGAHILSRAGYHVVEAADGEQAIALFEKNQARIDIAVLDVMMPKRSGREVADFIRTRRLDLPVVFASGYSFDVLGQYHAPEPEARLIKKPFTRAELMTAIRDMLDATPS